MKKILLIMLVLSLSLGFVGCGTNNVPAAIDAEQQQAQETKRLLNEVNNQIGLPNITNFYEKKMAKEIFELRDDSKLITYAYMQNLEGKFVYLGQCVGFGLPYSVQYTNPEKIEKTRIYTRGAGAVAEEEVNTVPQADPNGLYMPDGLNATWLMYINPETGKREVIYTEPSIVVTQSKLPRRLLAEWSIPENY